MEYRVAVEHGPAKLTVALLVEAQCPEHAKTNALRIASYFGLEDVTVVGVMYTAEPDRLPTLKEKVEVFGRRLDGGGIYFSPDTRCRPPERMACKYGGIATPLYNGPYRRTGLHLWQS